MNRGTDPTNPDSDGDGASDGYEIQKGTDPLDPESVPDKPNPVVDAIGQQPIMTAGALLAFMLSFFFFRRGFSGG